MLLAVVVCAALAACAADGGSEPSGAVRTPRIPDDSTPAKPSDGSTISTDAVPSDLLAQIMSAGAREAGVEADAVEVVVAESVIWSDGSIGCPEPEMMYTQALVPGYRVVLQADGRELNFHATESGDFRFCENPRPPLERSPNE